MDGRRAGKLQGGDVGEVFGTEMQKVQKMFIGEGGFVLGDDSATEHGVSSAEGFLDARG
jgi:hypothetical protein